MAAHGDIDEVSYSHPTLGQGVFFAISDQGNTLDKGGIRTSDDAGMIASNGSAVYKMNRVRSSFEIIIENDQNIRNDGEQIEALAASPDPAVWTITMINGVIWKGSGKPVGDIQTDTNTGQLTIKISGGTFEKISS